MNVYLGELYKEVGYIQSSGTQYIDTLFTPTPKTKISIDMQFTSTTAQQRLFGAGTSSTSYMTFNAYINGSIQWARAVQNGEGTWQSTGVSADTTRHIFELDNSTYKIYTNGTQVHSSSNSTTSTTSCSHSLILLANYYEGLVISQASAKLYGCKLWDNGTLVRDFIPCYRVSDNAIGLFDKVNNKFYSNAGTGLFTKGSDVKVFQQELKNAYIGEYVEETYTVPTASTRQAIGKSGFKIKQVIMKLAGKYSASSGAVLFMKLYNKNPNNQTITADFGGSLTFGTGHSSSTDGYGKFYSDNPSSYTFVSFPSTATSSTAGAYCITVNSDGTGNIKIGNTYGAWLYDQDYTLTSSQTSIITTVFNSQDTVVSKTVGSSVSSLLNELTVVYERI